MFRILEISFCPPPLGPKPPEEAFYPKKIEVDFKPLCCCNFMEKIRKVPCIDFSQDLKTWFGAHLGRVLARTLRNNIFPKRFS